MTIAQFNHLVIDVDMKYKLYEYKAWHAFFGKKILNKKLPSYIKEEKHAILFMDKFVELWAANDDRPTNGQIENSILEIKNLKTNYNPIKNNTQKCSTCDNIIFKNQTKTCRECRAQAIEKSRQIRKEKRVAYRLANYEKYQRGNKIYNDKTKEKRSAYYKNRIKNDKQFMLTTIIRSRIYDALKQKEIGLAKSKTDYFKYLGYSKEELIQHLESLFEPWMTWQNWGLYKLETWNDNDPNTWTWNLDHIKPKSEFIYSSIEDEEFKKCWALENLRPLNAKQNILDGTNRIRHNKENKNE